MQKQHSSPDLVETVALNWVSTGVCVHLERIEDQGETVSCADSPTLFIGDDPLVTHSLQEGKVRTYNLIMVLSCCFFIKPTLMLLALTGPQGQCNHQFYRVLCD